MKKKKDNYLLQGSILAIAGICVRLIGLVYRIPLNNILGEEGNGYYSTAFNIYNILLILSSYGMPIAVSKLVAGLLAKNQYKRTNRLFFSALLFSGMMGFICMMIAFFGAKFLATECFQMEPSYRALRILAPTIFIVSIMGVIRGFFQGHGNMVPSAISQIIEQIVNAIVSIVAAYYLLGYGMRIADTISDVAMKKTIGLSYAAAGSTLGTCMGAMSGLVVLMIMFGIFWKKIFAKQIKEDQETNIPNVVNMMTIVIATMVPIVASQLVYNVSDIIDNVLFGNIMKNFGFEQSYYTSQWGAYSSYFKLLVNIPIAIASSLAASIIPSVTLAFSKGDQKLVKKKISESVRFVMLIALPASVGLGVLASPIINMLFYGVSPLPAKLLSIGCITVVFYCLSTITNGILQGINHMWKAVSHAVIALVIHLVIVAIVLWVFHLEIVGVVLGNVAFSFLMCILNAKSIGNYTGYKQEWKNTFIKPAVSACVMGLVAYIVNFIVHSGLGDMIASERIVNMIAVGAAMVLAGLCYIIMLGVMKTFTRQELLDLPKGRILVRLMEKLRLL